MRSLTRIRFISLTCLCNGSGGIHDLIKHIVDHDVVLDVGKVIPAYDRLKGVIRKVLCGAATKLARPRHGPGGSGRDMVGRVVRDMERLSGLEDQDEEVESIVVRELAPGDGGFKGVTKDA
jgi:hypothetical protein